MLSYASPTIIICSLPLQFVPPPQILPVQWTKPMFCLFIQQAHTHTHTRKTQTLHSASPFSPCDYLWFWQLASWAVCRLRLGRGRDSWCWLLVQSQTESGIPPEGPCFILYSSQRVAGRSDYHLLFTSRASRVLIADCLHVTQARAACVRFLLY